MRTISFWTAGALSTMLFGCGGSPPPPAEQPGPSHEHGEERPSGDAPGAAIQPREAEASGSERASGVEPGAAKSLEDSIPDDYTIMHGDCEQLGKQLAGLTRSEQAAALSPRLTAEQRAQTEQRIEVVAGKLGEQYVQTCEKNVGQSMNPRSLKCAFDARNVKAFDQCLNGPPPTK
jgi:hypothetical protein